MAAHPSIEQARRFPIRLDGRFRWYLAIFGANEATAWVDVEGDRLEARFGWSRIETTVSNVARWSIEGPWNSLTALGVRRGNFSGGDITFGGSAHGGVRIDFRERPKVVWFHPPAVYLTVDDLEGFAAFLAERGIPGEDRRKAPARR